MLNQNSQINNLRSSMESECLRHGKIGDLAELTVQRALIIAGMQMNIRGKSNSCVQSEHENAQPAETLHNWPIISSPFFQVKRMQAGVVAVFRW
jgi:hypothetical protein